jgi:hypothetical protein
MYAPELLGEDPRLLRLQVRGNDKISHSQSFPLGWRHQKNVTKLLRINSSFLIRMAGLMTHDNFEFLKSEISISFFSYVDGRLTQKLTGPWNRLP